MAVLAVVAFLELGLNRILARLIHLEFLQPRSLLTRIVDDFGLLAFHLMSVLAVLALGVAIVRIALGGAEFRPGARASLPLIGAVFLVLASVGLCVKLPSNLVFHLHLSFLFLSLLLGLSAFGSPARPGPKLGVLFLLVALGLRLGPPLATRLGASIASSALLSGHLTLGAIAIAGLCFIPPRGPTRVASVLTWLTVCGAALVIRLDWDTAARVAAYGFGVDLPLSPWGQLLVLAAVAAMIYSTLRLLFVPGTARLRGYGLTLLALGGLQLELPGQLALAALGLLCIAASMVRMDGLPQPREVFDQIVKAGAAACGAQQVTVTGEPGHEIARLYSSTGAPVRVVVARRAGVIADLEVTIGDTPPRDPAFAVERRGHGRLGPHASGASVATDDAAFDGTFRVWDKRGDGAPLLDEETRTRMRQHLNGWLGVWPQRGLRYHATELPAGDDALGNLIVLLRELAARTA